MCIKTEKENKIFKKPTLAPLNRLILPQQLSKEKSGRDSQTRHNHKHQQAWKDSESDASFLLCLCRFYHFMTRMNTNLPAPASDAEEQTGGSSWAILCHLSFFPPIIIVILWIWCFWLQWLSWKHQRNILKFREKWLLPYFASHRKTICAPQCAHRYSTSPIFTINLPISPWNKNAFL